MSIGRAHLFHSFPHIPTRAIQLDSDILLELGISGRGHILSSSRLESYTLRRTALKKRVHIALLDAAALPASRDQRVQIDAVLPRIMSHGRRGKYLLHRGLDMCTRLRRDVRVEWVWPTCLLCGRRRMVRCDRTDVGRRLRVRCAMTCSYSTGLLGCGAQRRRLDVVCSSDVVHDLDCAEVLANLGDLTFLYEQLMYDAVKWAGDLNTCFVTLDFTKWVECVHCARGLHAPACPG